jgi:hypothetical protein
VEERDACGTGFVASIAGQRSHGLLQMAVEAVSPKPPEGLREPPPRVEEIAAEPATAAAR